MQKNCLRVKWDIGDEYINLDELRKAITDDDHSGYYELLTFDIRPDGRICDQGPRLGQSTFYGDGVLKAFSLDYWNPGVYRGGEVAVTELGTAHFHCNEKGKWTCKWHPKPHGEMGEPNCRLISTDHFIDREFHLTKVAKRERAFRHMVLEKDGEMCVLTGENQPEALDAAHILEVCQKGGDGPGNGITLRKDIHALFDARLFHINVDGNVETTDDLAYSYKYELAGKKLPDNTLVRVMEALRLRLQLDSNAKSDD